MKSKNFFNPIYYIPGAPSVQMHDTPDSFLKSREEAEKDPDKRQLMDDLKADHNGEYYDGDSDQDGEDGAPQEATWDDWYCDEGVRWSESVIMLNISFTFEYK